MPSVPTAAAWGPTPSPWQGYPYQWTTEFGPGWRATQPVGPYTVIAGTKRYGQQPGVPATPPSAGTAPSQPPSPATPPSSDPAAAAAAGAPLQDYINAAAAAAMSAAGRGLGRADEQRTSSFREAALRLGSVDWARQLLGSNDPILGSISADPEASLSDLARNARTYLNQKLATNESLSGRNLFFSSHRGNELTNLAYGRQVADAQATQAAQDAVGRANEVYNQALAAYEQQMLAAEQMRLMWLLQNAPYGGYGFGFGDEGGGGFGGGGGAPRPGGGPGVEVYGLGGLRGWF